MEKSFNLKVSVRMNERCGEVIDQVSFNQLILFCGKEQSQHKKFQVDKIYSASDSNQKLFQNILRMPSNLMLEGFSSVVFCLGSPGSGKTYSLAGKTYQNQQKEVQPGIMTYMMRRLFSKFKHQVSLYSTYSFWCKFLFVEKGKIRNLQGQLQEKQWSAMENTKILIKNYSHFEQLIQLVYSSNNNKCHTIIQLILQKQTANQQPTTSSVTFVQFGSFFYNCPYRQAQKFSMENDIEATLLIIKNLERTKQMGTNNSIFDSSLLTRLLKKTLMKACSFQFLGLIDDSSPNNLKTLNFLDMYLILIFSIMHKKKNYVYSKNTKQQIKRDQIFLKGLYEKHRRVLNLLSRCIGMELGYLDKEKKRGFDGPVLNTFYKTCQKIKYANQKKLQNQKLLQQIKRQIQTEKAELSEIDTEYQAKFQKLQKEKQQILAQKHELTQAYESIVNPCIKFSQTDNSLYCKLNETDQNSYKKFNVEEEQKQVGSTYPVETERESRNQGKSYKMLYSSHQISNRKNAPHESSKSVYKPPINQRYQRTNQNQLIQLNTRRLKQLKCQIGKIYSKILQQNSEIEKDCKRIAPHNHSILNKIKNKSSDINFNVQQAQKCYVLMLNDKSHAYEYQQMLENIRIHGKVEKDLAMNSNSNSMGVISLRSLRSDKQFKNM